jgi:DNA-binding Xre family transcriptional regulator
MAFKLQKKLGAFLRKRRGDLTLLQFSKKLGISDASLHRMEQGEQNVTLNTLERISERLKCRVGEMLGE